MAAALTAALRRQDHNPGVCPSTVPSLQQLVIARHRGSLNVQHVVACRTQATGRRVRWNQQPRSPSSECGNRRRFGARRAG